MMRGAGRLFMTVVLLGIARGHLRSELTDSRREGMEVNNEQVTMDLVLVHCKEEYDLETGGNGRSRGFSPVVWDVGTNHSILRVHRSFIYTKCRSPPRVGPAFKTVNISYESPGIGKSFEREESGYIQFILDHYHDLADWTIFVHGYPEEHNSYLFAWLDAFKRQKPTSKVYVPINSRQFVHRGIDRRFLEMLGLKDEVSSLTGPFLDTSTVCCAQFIVSSQAIRHRSLEGWSNIQRVFKQKEYRLLVQEMAMNMLKEEQLVVVDQNSIETRKNTTKATSLVEPPERESIRTATTKASTSGNTTSYPFTPTGDAIDNVAENPELMRKASVDREGSMAHRMFETMWPLLFGQPARGHNVLFNHTYWCTWFEEQQNSPCSLKEDRQNFRTCFNAQVSPCPSENFLTCENTCGKKGPVKKKKAGVIRKTREALLSDFVCCGSR
jgi:hypothetical protein